MNAAAFAGSLSLLLATTAFAETVTIHELPDDGKITLRGVVESVEDERHFVLKDDTGTVDISIASTQSVVLKQGDRVVVDGRVDRGWFGGVEIEASAVDVEKNLVQTLGEAIEGSPVLPSADADIYEIGALPDAGMVKIAGVVSDVKDDKKFTLRDDTGSININIESAQSAAVTRGASVTVIGSIKDGVLKKDVTAHKVFVTSDAEPVAAK